MKTIIKVCLSVCISLLFVSCDEESISTPVASVTVNQQEFSINETMVIHFTGVADQVSIYTGDNMHKYDLRTESNTGFVVNKGLFTYSYSVSGQYKVVCVASTYSDKAEEIRQDTCSFIVTVTDDVTEIDKLSCAQVLYDEVFAQKYPNDEWLMVLPRKVKYSTAAVAIPLTGQRLKFYIQSDSTKVLINGNPYVSATKYNLTNPVDIQVTSNYGTVRPYKLYTIYYPEFDTFKLNGVAGTVVRSEFDYSYFEIGVTLPTGTDVTNLVPEFSLFSPTDKVYIGDVEQISGSSAVDFTQNVSYRMVSTSPDNPDMQAESTIKIKISYQ